MRIFLLLQSVSISLISGSENINGLYNSCQSDESWVTDPDAKTSSRARNEGLYTFFRSISEASFLGSKPGLNLFSFHTLFSRMSSERTIFRIFR